MRWYAFCDVSGVGCPRLTLGCDGTRRESVASREHRWVASSQSSNNFAVLCPVLTHVMPAGGAHPTSAPAS
eukprot:3222987-Rhodomonas_salina.1